MLQKFKQYLITRGFKEYSENARPSTVIDYVSRVNKICLREGMTEQQLADNINTILEQYGRLGEKWTIGKKSHESYFNALLQFKKFVLEQRSEGFSIFKFGSSKY